MATALSTLCLLLLLCCSGAGASAASSSWGASRGGAARECFFDGKLEALEPRHKAQSEAGSVEYFRRFNEADDRELTCAGVFAIRVVIDPKGLLLPRYANTHGLAYILQGRGIIGYSFPGCQEETHHHQQQYGYGYGYGYEHHHQHPDEHHKIHRFEQGDVVAMPAAAQRWLYNDGDVPLVAIYVFDTNNNINQLDPDMRKFLLAGGFSKGQPHFAENILKGIDARFLSEALGVSMNVAEKLQSQHEERGEIVRAELEHGLHLLIPPQDQHLHLYQHGQTCQRFDGGNSNNICTMALRHSVERLDQADVYSPGAGRITRLTSNKFPILNLIQMSAVRVDLYQDAILSPFWNFNAHSAMYTIRGYARVQVATENGTTVFDGVLRPGKLLIIPQGYLVATKAQGEGFQYIAFETNHNSMVTHVAGKNSVLSDLPVGVIASSYGISMEEAAELKNSRKHELAVFTPGSTGTYSQGHVGQAPESDLPE